MCRYCDIALIICLSVMFVGVENVSDHLPPPKNLKFIWLSPFDLNLTWEKPEGLDPTCRVNYTIEVHDKNCFSKSSQKKRTCNLFYTFNLSNEKGLCITVTTNSENCGKKNTSLPSYFTIPSPPVTLVRNLSCLYYSINNLTCTWNLADDVQDLSFYYRLHQKKLDHITKCSSYINDMMKIKGCEIYSKDFKENVDDMFFMFNGTHKGISVNNTFKIEDPGFNVKLKKPELIIRRDEQKLYFQTIRSGFEQFAEDCFEYTYTYTKCNEKHDSIRGGKEYPLSYDHMCKYTAKVQILFKGHCGTGESELSDEVDYGDNRNPNVPVLLAVIIVPLVVSCCLIACLVLIHRHKDSILPKIPEPSLLFKDMIYNNIKMTDDPRNPPVGPMYIPIEETVNKISFVPETTLLNKGQ
ncbi:interleukin-13 receptor subunit alpha-1 isoform X2 [Triplophysa dalaica]|uniref:interleukin-13 receptor subunit alpha-1 isoform X2 n=1 Tax=Triplophysa dalaica TaxID=1582913 RepID=UPI0024E01B10|nr:interleukin-13 receptor subunit alpha-1 isoform X2 [Triplophysa dalaica]